MDTTNSELLLGNIRLTREVIRKLETTLTALEVTALSRELSDRHTAETVNYMAQIRKTITTTPTPVKIDSRISFGLAYFTTEADANAYATMVEQRGDTRNGGWFHGEPCGREPGFDYIDPTLGKLYAVSEA